MTDQRVVIAGVGALGSNLVPLLRNVAADLVLVDFDRVEKKNVASQFFGNTTVGKSKAEALKQMMLYLYGLPVVAMSRRISEANVDVLLADATLVIDCLDNGEGRRLVQGHTRKHNVPCLHGALAADGGYGRVIWDEQFVIDDEDVAGQPTCEGGEHLPFITTTAAYLAKATQEFLKRGRKIGFSISPTGTIAI